MIINVSKTKEIVFRRPRVRCTDVQPSFVVDRMDEVKLLGVTLNSKLTFGLSAWGGFLTTDSVGRLNAVFKRAKRYGFTDTVYDVIGLLENADEALFSQIQLNNNHCLYHILPPRRPNIGGLRARGHDFTLPKCLNPVYRRSYIPRCLYNYF
jgi:hypothetical protein